MNKKILAIILSLIPTSAFAVSPFGSSCSINAPQINNDLTSGFSSSGAGTIDVCVSGTKQVTFNSSGVTLQANKPVTAAGIISNGTKFTTSGCSVSSTTGGASAGKFTLGANTCSVVITMNGATGLTAPNGWACYANDNTAPTVLISQSASSTTTATLSVPAGAGATDVISFSCVGY